MKAYNGHQIYDQKDRKLAPDCVKDKNGDVVLDLCAVCGRGEIELSEPCAPIEPLADD